MKYKSKIIIFSFLLAGMLSSCVDFYLGNEGCIKGSGSIVSEEFFLSDFSKVSSETVVDVEIVQGDEQEVIVEGHENMIDQIELTVSNGELQIDLRNHCYSTFQLKVFITLPQLDAVSIESTGNITLGDFENVASFDVSVKSTGSVKGNGLLQVAGLVVIESESTGKVDLELVCDELEVFMSSTGNVSLSGSCASQWVEMDGTGHYRCYGLDSDYCEVLSDGVGDAQLHVNEQLDVYINSVGSVYYKGDPVVSVNDKGTGSLVKVD